MNYAILRSLVESAWQIEPGTLRQYYPAYRGLFNGLVFGEGPEPENSVPFRMPLGSDKTAGSGKYVNVVPVRGVMLKHDMPYCGLIGTRTLGRRLVEGERPAECRGSVLLFESGGGQVHAVPELTDAIEACKKPVVAFVDGMACSAAMYAASYCKEIIASRKTDMTGSVGTMIESELYGKYEKSPDGMIRFRVYADGSEDKNGELEAALTGDFKLIKERRLNPANEEFKAAIRKNRPNVKDEHLTGRTYRAEEVVGVLVDAIGNFEFAIGRVAELARQNPTENNVNQSIIINMKEKYLNLAAALDVSELVLQDGYASLNEEQLATLEAALSAEPKVDETALNEAKATIVELKTRLENKPGADSAAALTAADRSTGSVSDATESFFDIFNRLKNEIKD